MAFAPNAVMVLCSWECNLISVLILECYQDGDEEKHINRGEYMIWSRRVDKPARLIIRFVIGL